MPKKPADDASASSADEGSKSGPSDSESDIEKGKKDKSKKKSDKPAEDSDDEDPESKTLLGRLKKKATPKKKKKNAESDDDEGSDGGGDKTEKKSMFGNLGKGMKWGKNKDKDAAAADSGDENSGLLGNKKEEKKKKKKKRDGHESSKKHSLQLITSTLKSRLNVAAKDVKGKPLHISETPSFVRADFGDGTGRNDTVTINDLMRDAEDEKSANRKKREVYVYVESASSGRFFRYAMDMDADKTANHDDELERGLKGNSEDNFGESREAAMQRLERLMHTGFLIIQGLLAGYSGETVYQAFAPTTDANFLSEYSTLSNETRRFYYILTTVSFVGALNNWRSVRDSSEEWRSRRIVEKAELLFLVFVYMAGLCFTLVAGVYDMDFYYHNGIDDVDLAPDVNWYDVALLNDDFKESIRIWRGLTIGRFICVLVGWLMCARILHRNAARAADAVRESESITLTLEAAKKRIAQLTGAKLDKMERDELQELARTQRNALEQTEHVLENLPSDAPDAFAMMPATPRGLPSSLGQVGFGGSTTVLGSPSSRARTTSTLPASISSKAPPALQTNFLEGDTQEL
jgi:hypothetical protein